MHCHTFHGKFTILTSGGQAFPSPVPTHYHKHTHHDFLCLKGQLKVWLNDQCKILNPGDYASVAPGAIRACQFIGDHTEIFGIITPAGFEHMFRGLGESYTGPMWPDADLERVAEKLNTGVANVMTEFDVIPCLDLKSHTSCATEQDQVLFSAERSFVHMSPEPNLETVTINDTDSSRIGPGEVAWLPAGTHFDIKPVSSYFKVFMYSQPGGLGDLVYAAGKDKPHTGLNCMVPDSPSPFDREKLSQYKSEFKFDLM
ncbi:Quercetin 2,3-dioxygenase [Fusarium oxysporum f. sp. cubense race 1]|uniref:Quercetin 2,3-dioxygenase n=1 Tax=Fusarium oxysporum f. sp. cubense (strain race 1) TaxID=1229664 RepID=N4U4H4_FUSC1|nr:Quercetin 2,3-dioxygenase [Fusarium oxysporum f. sp. cubense race 1]